jgi:broad specificity phosphatase PhoE
VIEYQTKAMASSNIEKVVYFVRHGQSTHNVAPVFQSPDSPLNENGRSQAEKVAERVSHLSFQVLISSTFQRAKETANAITESTGKQLEYSELFVERIKPTSINGKSYEDEQANTVWRAWEKSLYTPGLRVEDGENFDDLTARADEALAYLKNRPEKSIVVVTHGYFLRTIVARVLLGDLLSGDAFRKIQKAASMENTGITVLRYQSGFEEEPIWRLWIYNDHAHLAE